MKVFLLDVDGVLTNGQFLYSKDGKVLKTFGADDNDALCLLKPHIEIRFISGDKSGFEISKKRIVDDMKFPLDQVSTFQRLDWIAERYPLEEVIYMGDGIFDYYVMERVGYSIAPANSDPQALKVAKYVTSRSGAERAVAEACLHIMTKFLGISDPFQAVRLATNAKIGAWGA